MADSDDQPGLTWPDLYSRYPGDQAGDLFDSAMEKGLKPEQAEYALLSHAHKLFLSGKVHPQTLTDALGVDINHALSPQPSSLLSQARARQFPGPTPQGLLSRVGEQLETPLEDAVNYYGGPGAFQKAGRGLVRGVGKGYETAFGAGKKAADFLGMRPDPGTENDFGNNVNPKYVAGIMSQAAVPFTFGGASEEDIPKEYQEAVDKEAAKYSGAPFNPVGAEQSAANIGGGIASYGPNLKTAVGKTLLESAPLASKGLNLALMGGLHALGGLAGRGRAPGALEEGVGREIPPKPSSQPANAPEVPGTEPGNVTPSKSTNPIIEGMDKELKERQAQQSQLPVKPPPQKAPEVEPATPAEPQAGPSDPRERIANLMVKVQNARHEGHLDNILTKHADTVSLINDLAYDDPFKALVDAKREELVKGGLGMPKKEPPGVGADVAEGKVIPQFERPLAPMREGYGGERMPPEDISQYPTNPLLNMKELAESGPGPFATPDQAENVSGVQRGMPFHGQEEPAIKTDISGSRYLAPSENLPSIGNRIPSAGRPFTEGPPEGVEARLAQIAPDVKPKLKGQGGLFANPVGQVASKASVKGLVESIFPRLAEASERRARLEDFKNMVGGAIDNLGKRTEEFGKTLGPIENWGRAEHEKLLDFRQSAARDLIKAASQQAKNFGAAPRDVERWTSSVNDYTRGTLMLQKWINSRKLLTIPLSGSAWLGEGATELMSHAFGMHSPIDYLSGKSLVEVLKGDAGTLGAKQASYQQAKDVGLEASFMRGSMLDKTVMQAKRRMDMAEASGAGKVAHGLFQALDKFKQAGMNTYDLSLRAARWNAYQQNVARGMSPSEAVRDVNKWYQNYNNWNVGGTMGTVVKAAINPSYKFPLEMLRIAKNAAYERTGPFMMFMLARQGLKALGQSYAKKQGVQLTQEQKTSDIGPSPLTLLGRGKNRAANYDAIDPLGMWNGYEYDPGKSWAGNTKTQIQEMSKDLAQNGYFKNMLEDKKSQMNLLQAAQLVGSRAKGVYQSGGAEGKMKLMHAVGGLLDQPGASQLNPATPISRAMRLGETRSGEQKPDLAADLMQRATGAREIQRPESSFTGPSVQQEHQRLANQDTEFIRYWEDPRHHPELSAGERAALLAPYYKREAQRSAAYSR